MTSTSADGATRWARNVRWSPAKVASHVLVLGLLLLVYGATRVVAEPCPLYAISPETARRLFERMKEVHAGAGYRFDGIQTEKQLEIKWSLNGQPCPIIAMDFGPCTPPPSTPTLQLHSPADLLTRCPGLSGVLVDLSNAATGEKPADLSKPAGDGSPPATWPKAVAILAIALLALTRYLQAPGLQGSFGWRGLQQLVFAVVAGSVLFLRSRDAVDAALFLAWLGLAILLIDRARWARQPSPVKVLLFALFLFSLVAHWAFSHGGPGDAHLNLYSMWSPDLDRNWGQAPIALLRGIGTLTGSIRDTHIIWCNLVLSSLVPILLFGIVSELGLGPWAAISSAFIAAVHPLLIVFSGVLGRQPPYLFAACASLLALIRFLQRDDWTRFIAFVLGTLLAITCRPEGAHVVTLQLAMIMLLPANRRARGVALSTTILLAGMAFVYARQFAHGEQVTRSLAALLDPRPFRWTVLLDPDFTPAAWIAIWMLGVFLGLRVRAGWMVVTSLLGLHVVWQWTGVYEMFVNVERQVASARYETILLVPFAIGVALFMENLAAIRGAARAGAILFLIIGTISTFPRTYDVLLKPFTIDYEYHYLKHHALTLPPDSKVWVLLNPEPDEGFYDAAWVGRFVDSKVRFANLPDQRSVCREVLLDGSENYLYLGSSCAEIVISERKPTAAHEQWMRNCATIHSLVGDDAVTEVEVPGRRFTWHDFVNPMVRLGLYRLRDASICTLGGHTGARRG